MPQRFFSGYPWRFIVTNLNSRTLTLLDRLATDRRVTAKLGAAWEASMSVPSASPEVNILRSGGSTDPFLQEGISLIYGFRREDPLGTALIPWVCRFGGLCLGLEDNADTDLSTSTLQAWDAWMYLYSRPVRNPATGNLPSANGLSYSATSADQIAIDLIDTSILYDGECYIDTTSGQLDPCGTIDINFQRGTSVGEALDELMQTNEIEIMFTPVYDPVASPGIICELNVAPTLGQDQDGAIMAWDKPSRSLVGLNRRRDGTRRTNVIQYYAGQGGTPVAEYPTMRPSASESKYGVYFEQMFLVGKETDETESDALEQLDLRADGEITYQISPATARSPIALLDYMPGDSVPVYTSTAFREELATFVRVMEIPIEISDNAEEQVRSMTATQQEIISS